MTVPDRHQFCRSLRPGLLYRAALEGASFSIYAGNRPNIIEELQFWQPAPSACLQLRLSHVSVRGHAGMVLLRQHGTAATELRLVGGGSKNPLWRQVERISCYCHHLSFWLWVLCTMRPLIPMHQIAIPSHCRLLQTSSSCQCGCQQSPRARHWVLRCRQRQCTRAFQLHNM